MFNFHTTSDSPNELVLVIEALRSFLHTATSEAESKARLQTIARLAKAVRLPAKELTYRLNILRREWHMERLGQGTSGFLIVLSFLLGWRISKKWLAVPLFVGISLFHNSLTDSTPAVAIARMLGFRKLSEIHSEEVALKVLRGDFSRFSTAELVDPSDLLEKSELHAAKAPY